MPHEALFDLLERDVEQHRLRPLDVALARFLAERDTRASPSLLWLATLLSRQLADGHLCLDLDVLDALADEQNWPPLWRHLLRALDETRNELTITPPVADGRAGIPANAPLVLDGVRTSVVAGKSG